MTAAEVIAEMRERVGTSSYVVPVASVERWANALERAMREKDAEVERLRQRRTEIDDEAYEYAEQVERLTTELRLVRQYARDALAPETKP